MWLQLSVTLLVATSCAYALTAQEANQFTVAGACTPADGYIGAELSVTYSNGVTRIKANHIPDHEWDMVNPNTPLAPITLHEYTFNPPVYQADSNVSCLPQGPIGIAKNGVYIFNPTTGPGGNAKTDEEMGRNGGHTAPFGEYHYHYLPDNGIVWDSTDPSSQFVGVAFDGFPIYTIGRGVDVNKLDICHGMTVRGEYRYIASPDHFPYFLGCFRGISQVKKMGHRNDTADCTGVTRDKACTCDFCVIHFTEQKRALVDLVRELLRETGDQPSRRSKRAVTVGNCGTNMTKNQENSRPPPFGPPPNGGGGRPPPNGGGRGPPPNGGGRGPPPNGGYNGPAPKGRIGGCKSQQGENDAFGQVQQAGNAQQEDNNQPQQGGNGRPQQGNSGWYNRFNTGWYGRRPYRPYRPFLPFYRPYGRRPGFRRPHFGGHQHGGSRGRWRGWW